MRGGEVQSKGKKNIVDIISTSPDFLDYLQLIHFETWSSVSHFSQDLNNICLLSGN